MTRAGKPLTAFESDKARLLLAYLAVENGRAHRRELLAGLFWPNVPENNAQHSLSQALYSLRKKLQIPTEDPLFETSPQEVHFRTENVWLDVREFDSLIRAYRDHPHPASWACPTCLERLNQITDLVKGDFLAGLHLTGCQDLEDWLRIKQEAYHQKMVQIAGQLSEWYAALGDFDQALTHAMRQVALDPLNEAAHRQVMHLLARQGWRADALAQWENCRQILAEELGVEPEAETTALYQQILEQPEAVSLSLAGRGNLPAPLSPIVGRQTELAQLHQKLCDPACRLVTVLGPGGSGKTRLALEAGRLIGPYFSDGVFLVELDTLQADLTLLPAVAQAVGLDLGVNLDQEIGMRPDTILDRVCQFFQEKHVLLILDGFEGMLPESDQVARLLRRLPGLKILATSRLRLNLMIEQVFLVEGLAYPLPAATGDLCDYSAVQLFMDAARRAIPDFELTAHNRLAVAEICRLNQGIPLGILMAAAWVAVFSPAQIVQEIHRSLDFLSVDWRDLPDRHRSLRATFDHSFRFLRPAEAVILLRLSVLRGPFSAGRAQQVAGATPDLLKKLVEQSLLQRAGEGRFRMHDLLRQYAQEKLAAAPAENFETHLRYSQVFLEALAAWEPRLKSAELPAVLAEIDREYADILAAWQWAIANQRVHLSQRAVYPLDRYLRLRGLNAEGIALFQNATHQLDLGGITASNVQLWLRIGIALSYLLVGWADYEQAWQVINRVEGMLENWKDSGMLQEQALLQLVQGDAILWAGGNRLEVLAHYQKGLELMLEDEDPWHVSLALLKNAIGHGQVGNIRRSGELADQALAIQGSSGDPSLLNGIYAQQGYCHMLQGDYKAAMQVVQDQIKSLGRINNRFNQAQAKDHLALALYYAGQYEQARTLFEENLHAYTRPGEILCRLFDEYILACIYLLTGDYAAVLSGAGCSGDAVGIYAYYETTIFKGGAYLCSASWDQAEREIKRGLETFRAMSRFDMIGFPLALLGFIAYRRGDPATALDYLDQALVNGLEQGFFWTFLMALAVLAVMLAEAGDLERAWALYATVTAHPCAGNSRFMDDLFGKPLADLCAGLPAETSAAAQARGRARGLANAGQETLDWLRASPGLRDELLKPKDR